MQINSFTIFKQRVIYAQKFLLFFCLLCLVTGFSLISRSAFANETLYFGWYPGDSLSMNEHRANVFSKYLSDRSGLHIEPVQMDNADSLIAALQKNKIHLTSIPNYQYPEVHDSVHLLATPQFNSSSEMYLYIITTAAAGINTIDQLKGKSAGQVVENNELKCYFLAESLKAKPQDFLGKITVFQNLKDAVENVASGKVASTCISSTTYDILTRFDPSLTKRIKIIKRSPAYTMDPMVASKLLPDSVWWNLQSVLINMSKDYAAQQILLSMGFHGFASPIGDLKSYPHSPAKKEATEKSTADSERDKTTNAAGENNGTSVDSTWVQSAEEKATTVADTVADTAVTTKGTVSGETPPPAVDTAAPADANKDKDNAPSSANAANTAKVANDAGDGPGSPQTTAAKSENPATFRPTPATGAVGAAPKTAPTDASVRSSRTLFMKNPFLVGGALIVLVVIIGLTVLNMLSTLRKGKVLTVLLMMNNKLTAMQSHLDWRGKLHILSCQTGNALSEHAVRKLLRDIGHKSAMKMAIILNSDRLVFREFTFPLLANNEIRPAIHWRLKDMNIPYNEDSDTIHSMVIAKDRKKKEITVQAIVLPDNDTNGREWSDLKLSEDSTLCMEMALLSRFRHCVKPEASDRCMLAYRLNEHEAILLILAANNSFISRRIFGTSSSSDFDLPSFSLEMEKEEPVTASVATDIVNPTELWNNFLSDIRQTINFHSRQSGRALDTLYLAGPGVPCVPDPENRLAEALGLAIEPINLMADIEIADTVKEECPAMEILAGAAMLWHKKG